MKILRQIGIVFGICLIGEAIAKLLPIPFPGSVMSMALVFVLLLSGLLKPKHIQEKSQFLLKNMAFFFIPAGVGLMDHFEVIKESIMQILIICGVSTVITFAATAYTIRAVIALQNRFKKGEA